MSRSIITAGFRLFCSTIVNKLDIVDSIEDKAQKLTIPAEGRETTLTSNDSQQHLMMRAIQGDDEAVIRLIWRYYDRLAAHISCKMPHSLRSSVDVEDILQECFTDAWLHMRSFQPHNANSFYQWIKTIAERKLLGKIRAHGRLKRGGGQHVATVAPTPSSSVQTLLDQLVHDEHTPSSSVARREAQRALLVAMAGLKADYHQVLCLRYLKGMSVADVAAQMNRTHRAVYMLSHRAMKELRQALGHASKYLSRK